MRILALLLVAAVLIYAVPYDIRGIVDEINSNSDAGWLAAVNERYVDREIEEIRQEFGTFEFDTGPQKRPAKSDYGDAEIPTNFDSRTAFMSAEGVSCVDAVRDQGKCGSCWAFGSVEALSSRFCVQSGGKVTRTLSTQDVTSCGSWSDGCHGGWPSSAWDYMEETGVVLEDCWPYELPHCHHPCGSVLPAPPCRRSCKSAGHPWTKYHASRSYSVSSNEKEIQRELMANGPITATMEVYDDFPTYSSGVYKHTSGGFMGGHAIMLIGWGEDEATRQPYWIVQNSWNTEWGIDGIFWILRGRDECGIESGLVAGTAKL